MQKIIQGHFPERTEREALQELEGPRKVEEKTCTKVELGKFQIKERNKTLNSPGKNIIGPK